MEIQTPSVLRAGGFGFWIRHKARQTVALGVQTEISQRAWFLAVADLNQARFVAVGLPSGVFRPGSLRRARLLYAARQADHAILQPA